MPRSPEWVKPKEYRKWEPGKLDLDWGAGKRGRKVKEKKSKAPDKEKPQEQAAGEPGKVTGPGTPAGGERIYGVPNKGEPPAPHPIEGSKRPAIEGRKPGKDVEKRYPTGETRVGPIYGHAERITGPAIESDKRPRHQGAPPRATPLEAGRQFQPLGAAPERPAFNETERRHAAAADLVAQVKAHQQKALGRDETGEVVSPGAAYQSKAGSHTDKSIWTAEVVGHNEGKDTGKIRAIEAPFNAKATGPIPKIHDTAPINTTSPLARTVNATTELPKMGRQFAVAPKAALGSRAEVPHRIALTQNAEPLGQMALFEPDRGAGNLNLSQTSRTERQATVPPSLRAGRQMELFHHPSRFKVGS